MTEAKQESVPQENAGGEGLVEAIKARCPTAQIVHKEPGKAIVTMPPEDWVGVHDHPRERDYEAHGEAHHFKYDAPRAQGAVFEELGRVTGAVMDGELFKVDGHTRAYLYSQGQLDLPENLTVTVYEVANKEELNRLYGTFDNQMAAEEGNDKVTGAFRENGLKMQSPRLRRGRVIYALATAYRGRAEANTRPDRPYFLDVYRVVATFKDPLQRIDAMNPQTRVHGGVIAGALMLMGISSDYDEFFQQFINGDGEKIRDKSSGTVMDGVMALIEYMATQQRTGQLREAALTERVAKQTITCAEAWKNGKYLRKPPRASGQLIQYAEKAREQLGDSMTPGEKAFIQAM